MDSPAIFFPLCVNLHSVLRGYRASEHTTTGKTPYELISQARVPVLFPRLLPTQQEAQSSEDLPNLSNKVRKISVGDTVLVYNTLTRTNSKGVVKLIQSRNSYIVMIDKKE